MLIPPCYPFIGQALIRRCPTQAHEGDREWLELEADVFDCPSGPASELFINPFACNISPLDWELLQQARPPAGACMGEWQQQFAGL